MTLKLERYTPHKHRRPLRTFAELAAELGIKPAQLRPRMKMQGAPQPVCVHKSGSWYDPVKFKAWWDSLKKD